MNPLRGNQVIFLIGRCLVGGMYIWSGSNNLLNLNSAAAFAGFKGLPYPQVGVTLASLLIIAGGLSLVTGIRPRLGVAAVTFFLVCVTPIMHNWRAQDGMDRAINLAIFCGQCRAVRFGPHVPCCPVAVAIQPGKPIQCAGRVASDAGIATRPAAGGERLGLTHVLGSCTHLPRSEPVHEHVCKSQADVISRMEVKMEIRTTFGPVTVISVWGKIDGETFPQLVQKTAEIIDRGHASLVLDLQQVSEVTSGGLIALRMMAGYAVASGGILVLSGPRPHVAQILHVMGADQSLDCFPDIKTAQASLSSGSIQQKSGTHAGRDRQEDGHRSRGESLSDVILSLFAFR